MDQSSRGRLKENETCRHARVELGREEIPTAKWQQVIRATFLHHLIVSMHHSRALNSDASANLRGGALISASAPRAQRNVALQMIQMRIFGLLAWRASSLVQTPGL
jgi:hypothetical protein